MTPALLHSTCSAGCSRWNASEKPRTDARFERSSSITLTLAPDAEAEIRSAAVRALPRSRQARMTSARLRANSNAASYPIPLLPPVTTIVLPERSGMSAAVHAFLSAIASVPPGQLQEGYHNDYRV